MAILDRKSAVLILCLVLILSMATVKLVDGAATPNNPCKTGFEPECPHNQPSRSHEKKKLTNIIVAARQLFVASGVKTVAPGLNTRDNSSHIYLIINKEKFISYIIIKEYSIISCVLFLFYPGD